jgi:hypothetical protein
MAGKTQAETVSPAYVAWKTFLTALDTLQTGTPDVLDRSVWPTLSGGTQVLLLRSLRFLGLINASNEVQPRLRELVEGDAATRAHLMLLTLEEKYQAVTQLAITNGSLQQLRDAMGAMGLEGSAREKAISFYLSAAEFAGAPSSPLWASKKRTAAAKSNTTPRKKVGAKKTGRKKPPAGGGSVNDDGAAPMRKTVTLKGGGNVTISASIDLFAMPREDREWVIGLIDTFVDYEAKHGAKE